MSNTKSSGGQSSKGFLHWLKNTWLGRFWNWIVSYFRPKNKKTESQSASAEQAKVVNDDDNNDQSKSSEVGQEGVSKSNIIENGKLGSVSSPSQTPVNPESPTMSRSSSEASINDKLEWDDSSIFSSTSSQPEAQETSPQPGQKLGSSDTEKGTVFIAFLEAQKLFNDPVANKACIAFLEAVLSYNADEEYIRDHLQKLTDHPQFIECILNRFLMVSRLIENEIINRGELQSCNTSQPHQSQKRKLD